MKNNYQHIETAVVSRSPGSTYGHMYSMHKYWSKKSPDVVAAYIEHYTKPGDVVLDPFCGSGITACEAVRLGRRAITIDINPMATFITRMTLMPVNLSRLQWAFRDMRSACEEAVSELFITTCPRCGKKAVVEFVVREGDVPRQIAYKCTCSDERLFKDPDERDKSLDRSFEKKKIPFWYPCDVPLPIIQRERFQFLHELFTRRNLIALSTIFNAIEGLEDPKIREVMKLAFTAALDKCSRLKPLSRSKGNSRPTLSEGWVAVRFYAPRMWQEVNPWHAFARSFERVYNGKKESNAKLKNALLGSSYEELHARSANVVVLTGSADIILNKQLPEQSIDYVLTDPPFGEHIQYLALSTFWGAWLKFDFDYDRELVVNRHLGKTMEDYERHLRGILASIRKVIKLNKYVHIFYHDIRGPYLHKMLRSMSKAKILPERVLHQPPPNSFGAAVRNISRTGKGHYGSYIVSGRAIDKVMSIRKDPAVQDALQKKVAAAAKTGLEIRGGAAPEGTLLHSIYHGLRTEEILMFAQHPAESFLRESIKEFSLIRKKEVQLRSSGEKTDSNRDMAEKIRTALLDAKSLYVNNPRREDKKNQIYQHVALRFQESGITIDDIRTVERDIQEFEEIEHRKHRLPERLYELGELLNLGCRLTHGAENQVIWKGNDELRVLFRVTDKEILVEASRTMSEGDIASEVGSISDEDLENALLKWCRNNPEKGDKLIKKLNPMAESTMPSTSPKHLLLRVLENKKLCSEHYLISLRIPRGQDIEPVPGQFFHIICDPDGKKILTDDGRERGYALTLRRPFGVHRINYTGFDRQLLAAPTIIPYEIKEVIRRQASQIDILYKVIGEGTKNLSEVPRGAFLDVIGPIGKGFKIERGCTGVIVGGGIGVAPLIALAEKLRYLGCEVFPYFGALRTKELRRLVLSRPERTKELRRLELTRPDSAVELGFANGTPAFLELIRKEFTEIGTKEVRVSTDDGSLGKKGTVTDMLEKDIESGLLAKDDIHIYACGPSGMVKSVCDLANRHEIPCKVLLEQRMACGIGACFSCTCNTWGKDGQEEKKRVCVDGPVFDAKEIKW